MRLHSLIAPTSLILLLSLAACSSGGNTDPVTGVNAESGDDAAIQDDDPGMQPATGSSPEPVVDVNQNEPEPGPEPAPAPEPEQPAQNLQQLGVPIINDDAVNAFSSLLERVVEIAIVDLNRKLQSGESFSDIETGCLGAFDPAVGEALLAATCGDRPLALGQASPALQLTEGALAGTDECHQGLLALDGNACRLTRANLLIPIDWVTATDGSLPTPLPSGTIAFNITDGVMDIENLPDPVTGIFQCSFDLANGGVSSAIGSGGCQDSLMRLETRLQDWLGELDAAQ